MFIHLLYFTFMLSMKAVHPFILNNYIVYNLQRAHSFFINSLTEWSVIHPCLPFAFGYFSLCTHWLVTPVAVLWRDHSASEMLLRSCMEFYENNSWFDFPFLNILFFLFNYIIVTLWVSSVTRYAFLIASTSLILNMFINFIVVVNGYFCIMWEMKTTKIELNWIEICTYNWN